MSDKIETTNPYSGKKLKSYDLMDRDKVESKLELSEQSFQQWKTRSLSERVNLIGQVAEVLTHNLTDYANIITQEMGKPISESKSEIEKCVWLCDFYKKNANQFLADALIKTEATESFISYDPLGVVLAVMPWNYPFWQVMRFAIPTLTAGNTALLKHASNVTGCAMVIQDIFEKAGYPKGCFQTLITSHENIENIIGDRRLKAVSLTGSEKAGRKIAQIAGKHLKKTVLELGGNNACVILDDANLDKYLDIMVKARMQNTGQSCIAAKRFIVVESIYDEFLKKFTTKVEGLKEGDPMKENTDITVLARPDLADTLYEQVDKSISKGAKIYYGNKYKGAYYQPTIVTEVQAGMPIFEEETFGPVAAIIKVKDEDEAYNVLSNTKFGLGTMLFTENIDKARKRILDVGDGAFFINEMVKSDPRLPFGGTRASGYGRELSKEGIMEFVNKKTVYINQ